VLARSLHTDDTQQKSAGDSDGQPDQRPDDARRYDAFAVPLQTPTLIYQGTADEVVSPDQVRRWASSRPWVILRLVDDGHQLLGHLEAMWADIARFLGAEA